MRVPRAPAHQGRYYQQLTESLGVAPGPLEPRVDVPEALRQQAREQLVMPDGTGGRYWWQWRQVPPTAQRSDGCPAYFAEVIAALMREPACALVLVGSAGDAAARPDDSATRVATCGAPIDLVGARR